jgi:hypothetical protein
VAPSGWSGGADPKKLWAVVAYQGITVAGIVADSVANFNSDGIGLGYKNSEAIVAQGNNTTTAAGSARAFTTTVSGTTFSDWYLPTTVELNQMCKWANGVTGVNLTTLSTRCEGGTINTGIGSTGFTAFYYWSSSANGTHGSWRQALQDGVPDAVSKASIFHIRPIRAF